MAVGTSNQISVSRQRCGIEVYYTDDINQVKDEVNTKLCYSEPLADGGN